VKSKNFTILKTAVGCLSAAGFIKELKKRNVKVVGVDCDPFSAGFFLCDKSYVVPRGNDPLFIEKIIEICDREKPDAIFSGPEEEILALSKHKEEFTKRGIFLFCPDYEVAMVCFDKIKTYKVFKKYNIPVPRLYRNFNEVKFPCIVKPRFGRGSRDVFKIRHRDELDFYLRDVESPLIQEFIDGVEYTVDVFADLEGNPLSIVPRVRLKIESGISVKAVTVYNERVIEYCRRIINGLKLTGPSCIQCIEGKDGPKFIEINPRFGGGSVLSLKADPGIVENIIKIIRKEKPHSLGSFKKGLMMLRYYNEIFRELKEYKSFIF